MKKFVLSLFFVMAAVLSLTLIQVSAENTTNVVFGQTYTGNFTAANTSDTYTVVLTQPGRLTVNVIKPTSGGLDVHWFDSVNVNKTITGLNNRTSYNEYLDLEAGTYYIKVEPYLSTNTGTYNLTATFPSNIALTVTAGKSRYSIGEWVYADINVSSSIKSWQIFWTRNGQVTSEKATVQTVGELNGNFKVGTVNDENYDGIALCAYTAQYTAQTIPNDYTTGGPFIARASFAVNSAALTPDTGSIKVNGKPFDPDQTEFKHGVTYEVTFTTTVINAVTHWTATYIANENDRGTMVPLDATVSKVVEKP